MFKSHCVDHDNCPLDLVKLKAAMKDPMFDIDLDALRKRIDAINEQIKERRAAGDVAAAKKGNEEYQAAWTVYHQASKANSPDDKTMLCSIRAHDRGRLHCRRRRQPDGTVVDLTLEDQEPWIQSSEGQKVLSRFLRTIPQAQSAA